MKDDRNKSFKLQTQVTHNSQEPVNQPQRADPPLSLSFSYMYIIKKEKREQVTTWTHNKTFLNFLRSRNESGRKEEGERGRAAYFRELSSISNKRQPTSQSTFLERIILRAAEIASPKDKNMSSQLILMRTFPPILLSLCLERLERCDALVWSMLLFVTNPTNTIRVTSWPKYGKG